MSVMGTGISASRRTVGREGTPKDSAPTSVCDLEKGSQVDVVSTSDCGCASPWRKPPPDKHHQPDDPRDVIKTGPTWKERLEEATQAELWDGRPRRERPGWRRYIRDAQRLARAPRRTLSTAIVSKVLAGDLNGLADLRPHSSKVTVFLSSTFTDTKAERNQLMKDVFPFVRAVCQVLGLDFGTVDMRWGVRDETTREHGTTDICLQQVTRCCNESCGPAFLAILSNKYGYRPLPVRIKQSEFDILIRDLKEQTQPIKDLTENYLLDENNVPPIYILKPRDPSMSNGDWWTISQEMQRKLRLVAKNLPVVEERDKYFISVTEQEIHEGCFKNDRRNSQVVYINRNLEGVTHEHHQNRHLVDMADGVIDDAAQEYMHDLKSSKFPKHLIEIPESVLNFSYSDQAKNNLNDVKRTCDEICRVLCDMILNSFKGNLHIISDTLYDEVIRHSQFLLTRCQVFKGHKVLLAKILDKVLSKKENDKKVIALHGTSGSGKTSVMAVLAKSLKMVQMCTACLIVRFIGTTSASGSVYDLLQSICHQITRVYDKKSNKVPDDYEALLEYFTLALTFSTSSKPLIIVLDSLDQLPDENLGCNLKWLPIQTPLPANTHIIVSTNHAECLDVLKAHLPRDCIFELTYLPMEAACQALKGLMVVKKRTLTEQHETLLLKAFEWNPFPLYLKMLVDLAVTWRSHDVITEDKIAAGAAGMTSLLFERLEGRYGQFLVQHALGYISASKNGLSQNELEDMLSCDDDALDELFEFWMPPVRRIPPLLWIRIRNDLSDYLMEKGSDGTILYTWYYKQIRQMAAERYLDKASPPFRQAAHTALAEYFDGRWTDGKMWVPKATSRTVTDLNPRMENRMVTAQPLVFAGERGEKQRQLNKRKLRELPHHLLGSGDLDRLEAVAADLEFVEAKFEAEQGYDCMSDLKLAATGEATPLLTAMGKVVCSGLQYLLREPGAIYQLVRQQVEDNPSRALLAQIDRTCYPLQYVSEESGCAMEDPCDLSLRGHTSGVRCCHYSPDGTYIASTGEDGSLRIWDAQTGAEHVTVMGLPGPVYSKMAEVGSGGERPCVWDVKGESIITGSEDGYLQACTRTGAQTQTNFSSTIPSHNGGITGLSLSPDNTHLASSSKDGTLKIWSMRTHEEVTTIEPGHGEIRDCGFSADGKSVAIVYIVAKDRRGELGSSGLNVYSVPDWWLKSSRYGDGNRKLCCLSFSPDGAMIATGSDLNVVELWLDGRSEAEVLPKRHHAHVKCVRFSHEGRYVISCGDDFMVMVWDVPLRRHLVTVSGHMHRVTSVSVHPKGQGRIVTGSRDCTLKVWNYDAIIAGSVPDADGIPFVVLQPSHHRKYVMSVQGVNSFARVYETRHVTSNKPVGRTPKQKYSVSSALWTPDDSRIVLLTAGHSGNFTNDAYNRASVHVTKWITTDNDTEPSCTSLEVKCPSAIAVNKNLIAVGTYAKNIKLFDLGDLEESGHIIWDEYTDEDLGGNPGKGPEKCTDNDPAENPGGGQVDAEPEEKIISVDLRPLKDHLAAVCGNTLRVWSLRFMALRGPKLKAHLTSNEQIQECKYTPNGKYLIYISQGSIGITAPTSGRYERLHVISGHVDLIHPISVCPQSRHLATASLDGTVRVWSLGTGGVGLVGVWYNSTARRVGFVSSNVLLIGGGTGPPRKLVIEEAPS